jgi:hypothetical protein
MKKRYKLECCNDSRYVERDYEHDVSYWKAWMGMWKILNIVTLYVMRIMNRGIYI